MPTGADIMLMTDPKSAPNSRALWAKRGLALVAAAAVIAGLFFVSNAVTIAWHQHEDVRNQIRADVRSAVAAIKAQPQGPNSKFIVVDAPNDYAVGYEYKLLQASDDVNVVPVQHNEAVDRILILPAGSSNLQHLTGNMDAGSTIKGYRVVGVSLSNEVKGFAYSFDSKSTEYKDTSFDANSIGGSAFDTQDATLIYSKRQGGNQLTVSATALLAASGTVKVPQAAYLNDSTQASFTSKATKLTAFKLNSKQVTLYDRNGKVVDLKDASWDATFIVAKAPQASSIQLTTALPASVDETVLADVHDGGQVRVNYRGLSMTFKFTDRTLAQVFANQ